MDLGSLKLNIKWGKALNWRIVMGVFTVMCSTYLTAEITLRLQFLDVTACEFRTLFHILFCYHRQLERRNVAGQVDCCNSGRYAVSSIWTHTVGDRDRLWYFDLSPRKKWTVSLHGQVVMKNRWIVTKVGLCILLCNIVIADAFWLSLIFHHVTVNIQKYLWG